MDWFVTPYWLTTFDAWFSLAVKLSEIKEFIALNMYKNDFLKFRRLREFLILIIDHLWYYIDNLMLNFEFHICS